MHRLFNIYLVSGLAFACSEDLDRRYSKYQSEDAEEKQGNKEVRFFLPDRSPLSAELSEIESLMNSYYISFDPEGDNCDQTEKIEKAGTYEDNKMLSYELAVNCDYLTTVLLGKANLDETLRLQTTVSYETYIKPLLDTYCISCHEEYSTYEGTIDQQENIIVQVENQTMPPDEQLSDFAIASFLGWQAGGFVDKDPEKGDPNSLLASFDETYYRNDLNQYIYSEQLVQSAFVLYDESVWLQSDGSELGLDTIELVFDHYDESDSNLELNN